MLEPNQFTPNEAWVVFQLNDAPVHTEDGGDFNCIVLMDAASCFLLGHAFAVAAQAEPPSVDVRRLFTAGWKHQRRYPRTLFVPKGQFPTVVPAEAVRNGITVVTVAESELALFTSEAREGFREMGAQ